MAQGANSDAVWRLQWTLNKCYYRAGVSPLFPALLDLDGDFGPKTKSALTYAQRPAGANPDGGYGPETRNRINHHYSYDRQGGCRKSSPHQQLFDSATTNTMRRSSRLGLHA
jgi:peptidoglycan hydrolase-like protein with peptidoglycan-binding domain